MKKLTTFQFLFAFSILSISCEKIKSAFPLGWGDVREYDNHLEMDLGFENNGAVLAGVLYLPKSPGQHPVMVHNFGSDKWESLPYSAAIQANLDEGLAMFFYDKRGVGDSQGNCCPWQDPDYFVLLAGDIKSAVRALSKNSYIDSNRIGLYGFSQGGWIVPIVAADTSFHFAWTVIGSGPTVTLGEELFYGKLSGDDNCINSNLSDSEINELMDLHGKSGFDPLPYLKEMKGPCLWAYGGLDRSIPINRSIEILNDVKYSFTLDFTVILMPSWNHCWVVNGPPCDCSGTRGDQYFIFQWIKEHAGL